jgi:photosystem II CP43 chlorophyll apoprotein
MSLGCGSLLLVAKAMYIGGVYDTWAPGGDVRFITTPTLNPRNLLLCIPFSIWWRWLVVSVNNMEDVGGHVLVRYVFLVVSGIFSQNHLLGHVVLLFGQVKHTIIQFSCYFINGPYSFIIYAWYNNTAYPSELYGPTGPKLHNHKHLHS